MKKIKFSLPTHKELISVQPVLAEWSQSWAFWPLKEVMKSLNHQECFVALATQEDQIVGFSFWKCILEDAELLFVFVPEAQRGKGVAKELLAFSMIHLESLGAKMVSLEVRPSNRSAVDLYGRLGFSILSTRKNYYKDGESAHVFSKELP